MIQTESNSGCLLDGELKNFIAALSTRLDGCILGSNLELKTLRILESCWSLVHENGL